MFWKSTCVNTNVHEQRNHRHPQVHIREPSRRPTCRRSYRQRKEADFVNPRPQNISIIIVSQSPWSISTTRTTTATAKWGRPAKGPRYSRERAPPAAPRERRSVEMRFSLVAPPLYSAGNFPTPLEERVNETTLKSIQLKSSVKVAYAPPPLRAFG